MIGQGNVRERHVDIASHSHQRSPMDSGLMTEPAVLLLAYVLAALAFTALERRRLAPLLRGVGRPAAYFAVLSVCLLFISQSYLPGGDLYPYTSWTMYTQPAPARSTWQVNFVRRSGTPEVIPMATLLRGPNTRAVMRHLTVAAGRIERATPEQRPEYEAALDTLLDALARLDGRRFPDDPVRQITIHRCVIAGDPPWSARSFECELLLTRAVDAQPGDADAP